MTEKEKAKAYDKAIERAKKLYGNGITEEIFPELKEDDAERIIKNCIHFLELQKQHHAATFEIEECIAWLEKQCKQLADKNKPKFDVGDWVVFIKSKSVYRVEKKENYEYTLRYILGGSMCLPFSNEELIREWTIEDAKDGDVLTTSSGPFIYNGKRGGSSCPGCYCGINTLGRFEPRVCETHWTSKKVYPATQGQRNALMKTMNDAGYKWNAETKTLDKLIKPKFKVGDKIVNSYMEYMGAPGTQRTILKITDDKYIFTDGSRMSISSQDS